MYVETEARTPVGRLPNFSFALKHGSEGIADLAKLFEYARACSLVVELVRTNLNLRGCVGHSSSAHDIRWQPEAPKLRTADDFDLANRVKLAETGRGPLDLFARALTVWW